MSALKLLLVVMASAATGGAVVGLVVTGGSGSGAENGQPMPRLVTGEENPGSASSPAEDQPTENQDSPPASTIELGGELSGLGTISIPPLEEDRGTRESTLDPKVITERETVVVRAADEMTEDAAPADKEVVASAPSDSDPADNLIENDPDTVSEPSPAAPPPREPSSESDVIELESLTNDDADRVIERATSPTQSLTKSMNALRGLAESMSEMRKGLEELRPESVVESKAREIEGLAESMRGLQQQSVTLHNRLLELLRGPPDDTTNGENEPSKEENEAEGTPEK